MLRRRDLLTALTATGVLAACGTRDSQDPATPATRWPGDLPTTTATWQELPPPPIDPRGAPTLTWTGAELLVVGGTGPVVGPVPDCPANASCAAPPTEPVTDSGAYDPATGTWRRFPEPHSFHHGTTWTGNLLTDGWSWFDPATGGSGPAPESDLLVYAPAWWSGTEVLCVGTDGSGQPVPHTLWAWNPATGTTRTSRVPGPDSGESCCTIWTADELLVGLTQVPDGYAGSSVQAYDPAHDRWRAVPVPGGAEETSGPTAVPFGGWDGRRLIGTGWNADQEPRLERVDPVDGTSDPLDLPAALQDPRWAQNVVVGPGHVAVGVGGRYAVLHEETWTALPALPGVVDGDPTTVAWAGDRLVVWDDSMERTGWQIQPT